MNKQPAIVLAAYNRPQSLQRLLQSLNEAKYPSQNIELIISIDNSGNQEVAKVAQEFAWQHGTKKITEHTQHLGLKNHILYCGNLTEEYEALIVLEDDLLVSKWFYYFAAKAAAFYNKDQNIAGVSLYNYQISENGFYPFKAIDDGADVYFMQVASSWGQLWTADQWRSFKTWFATHPELNAESTLPDYLFAWGKNSWKKHFAHYLVSTNKYFVFPRLSHSTNFEEAGTNAQSKNVFHVPLRLSNKEYVFVNAENSAAVYDAWFELLPRCLRQLNKSLESFEFAVDLYGTKNVSEIKQDYVLTSKQSQSALHSFSNELFPLESNVALNLQGNEIGLYKVKNQSFIKQENGLKSVFDNRDSDNKLWISVIIPVSKKDVLDLAVTLDSIAKQEYRYKDCLIVAEENCLPEVKTIKENYSFRISAVPIKDLAGVEEKVRCGFNKLIGEVGCYLKPGSVFTENSLEKAGMVFQTHQDMNWIRGIDKAEEAKSFDTMKYRLIPSEAYAQLKNNSLRTSLEGHFLRTGPLRLYTGTYLKPEDLFLQLLLAFPQILAVSKFVSLRSDSVSMEIDKQTKTELLSKYKSQERKAGLKKLILKLILKAPFIRPETSQWLFASMENYPDVLRYDEVNKRFYFSKC